MSGIEKISRRRLLALGLSAAASGAAGLVLGFRFGERRERWKKRVPPRPQPFSPNVFLAVGEDDVVTIWLTRIELGQGVMTALPAILAEELDADWRRVRVVQAEGHPNFGEQMTVVSSSVRSSFDELRMAGATARQMLIAAGATAFRVPSAQCSTEEGAVVHAPTGRRLRYGDLARVAAGLPVPKAAPLKGRAEYRLVGTPVARLDVPGKLDGSARFTTDIRLPGMGFAVVIPPPRLGARLLECREERARAIPGVRGIYPIDSGVAVLGDDTWAALRGRELLELRWEDGPNTSLSDASIEESLRSAMGRTGVVAEHVNGHAEEPPAGARRVEASYLLPYLAHATMEPMCCVAWVRPTSCTLFVPSQDPQETRRLVARTLSFAEANVEVQVTMAGGAFGRRVEQDFVKDAVEVSRRAGCPVSLMFTREDDFARDFFRPAAFHSLVGSLDSEGWPVEWTHRIASPSISRRDPRFEGDVDPVAVEGAVLRDYRIPRRSVEWIDVTLPVPVGFWRSVGHSHNAFAVECFLDELARAGNKDPLDLRRRLLADAPRPRAVLELAAKKAGWEVPPPAGRARGLALHSSFESHVAQVAEISMGPEGRIRVHRVVAAVDCGLVVNPKIVEQQIEGGIVFGLTAALFGRVRFENGGVLEKNFGDYRLLDFGSTPRIEVYIVDSNEAPGGVGEIAVPPAAPAVANAVFAATGRPVRKLPLSL